MIFKAYGFKAYGFKVYGFKVYDFKVSDFKVCDFTVSDFGSYRPLSECEFAFGRHRDRKEKEPER